MRERENADRTREAGSRDEVEGGVANILMIIRSGAVGFIDWLDALPEPTTDLTSDTTFVNVNL